MEHRTEFRGMLKRTKEHRDVDVVIVYKLSRLARNRLDEAIVMNEFHRRGVRLISATEPINDTPEGQLMQGVLSAMNQFRSQQDGADIAYKLGEKAKKGGTIGYAPIGYLNVKELVDGYSVSTVSVDEERAPFVKLAYQLCAEGRSILQITEILADRGLLSRKTRKLASIPLGTSQIQRILRNPYYTGVINYKGHIYPGRHTPIIDTELFLDVQDKLDARSIRDSRYRLYDHPLKGIPYCGECREKRGADRRMTLQKAINKRGDTYWYYFCSGHVDHTCDSRFINITRVEDAIQQYYQTIALSPELIYDIRECVAEFLRDSANQENETKKQLEKKLVRLKKRESKLVELAIDDDLPRDIIREKTTEIQTERTTVEHDLANLGTDFTRGENLGRCSQSSDRPRQSLMAATE